jgi:hypothetical protein
MSQSPQLSSDEIVNRITNLLLTHGKIEDTCSDANALAEIAKLVGLTVTKDDSGFNDKIVLDV